MYFKNIKCSNPPSSSFPSLYQEVLLLVNFMLNSGGGCDFRGKHKSLNFATTTKFYINSNYHDSLLLRVLCH